MIATFVLPGFVTLLLRERTYVIKGEDTPFERLLTALYYSALVFAVLSVGGLLLGFDARDVARAYDGDANYEIYVAFAVAGLFIIPLAIAEIGRRWQGSRVLRPWFLEHSGVDPGHSVPAGWEHFFGRSEGAFEGRGLLLRITLDDGRVIAGFFGKDSLAGYTAHTRDLFIEERWILDDDDWFKEPAEDSRGVWISEGSIRSVEAYAPPQTEAGADDGPGND